MPLLYPLSFNRSLSCRVLIPLLIKQWKTNYCSSSCLDCELPRKGNLLDQEPTMHGTTVTFTILADRKSVV